MASALSAGAQIQVFFKGGVLFEGPNFSTKDRLGDSMHATLHLESMV